MTVWLQREPGIGMDAECKLIYRHCLIERIPTTYFCLDDLTSGRVSLAGADLVVGTVELLRAAFQHLGISEPDMNYYPPSLQHHLHRTIRQGTFADVWATIFSDKEIFAKSVGCKLLTGRVFCPRSMPQDDSIPSSLPVLMSEPVNFLCEYRVYVLHHKIIESTFYFGDDEKCIDMGVVQEAVDILAQVKETPDAYAFDWGLLSSGETALVEMNDAWAIGAYLGISANAYYSFLTARWQQLMKGIS